MEKRKTKKGLEVGNDHPICGDRAGDGDSRGGAFDGHAGIKSETGAAIRGADPHIVVHGRGRGNWEVLVDGHCVARFDTKAEAFQWAEILMGKEDNGHE